MRVLMITGDKRLFEPGTEAHERFLLQQAQVKELCAVVWDKEHPFAFLAIFGHALTFRFDVITSQDPLWRGLVGLVAARLCGARLQVQLHGDLRATHGVGHILLQITLWHADLVRAVSEKVKEQAEEIGTQVFVDVLPVFVDLHKIEQAPAADVKKEFPQFGKTVLFVGRLEEEKNPLGAVRVFADVARVFPGAGLLIAGEGSLRPQINELAQNLGLSGKVILLGYRADLPSLYKSVDCLLVTSAFESFGAGIVEALAADCAVVSPDVGVAREAGAQVVEADRLANAVVDTLKSGARGSLHMELPHKAQWAQLWRQTLY